MLNNLNFTVYEGLLNHSSHIHIMENFGNYTKWYQKKEIVVAEKSVRKWFSDLGK